MIEENLLQLMQTGSFSDITVTRLCNTAGIPRKSFYRYFESLDSVLHSLIHRTLIGYETFRGNPGITAGKRTVAGDLENIFLYWQGQKPLLNALNRSDLLGVMISQAVDLAMSAEVIPRRFLPDDTEEMRRDVLCFTAAGFMSLIVSWFRQNFSRTAAEETTIALRVLLHPIFPDAESII